MKHAVFIDQVRETWTASGSDGVCGIGIGDFRDFQEQGRCLVIQLGQEAWTAAEFAFLLATESRELHTNLFALGL